MGRLQEVREAIAACFHANPEPLTKVQSLTWIGNNYPNSDFNTNTLQAQLYRSCVNTTSTTSAPKILWYEKSNRTYRLTLPTDPIPSSTVLGESEVEGDAQADSTFALEAHLRDYLARNLSTLEKGLSLWNSNPPSVEYAISNRRIDVLAKDIEGTPVVIELKLSKSYDRVIGQALLYRGLVSKQLNVKRVRIMLIAGDVSDELKIACSGISDVLLYEYAISFQTKIVSSVVEEEA